MKNLIIITKMRLRILNGLDEERIWDEDEVLTEEYTELEEEEDDDFFEDLVRRAA